MPVLEPLSIMNVCGHENAFLGRASSRMAERLVGMKNVLSGIRLEMAGKLKFKNFRPAPSVFVSVEWAFWIWHALDGISKEWSLSTAH